VEKVNEFVRDELPVEKAYQMLQTLTKGCYVVDKTPPYALDIETLYRAEIVSENPFYLFLFRHPLSVIESLVRNRFDKMMGIRCDDPWALGEQAWQKMNRNIVKFLSGIPYERQMQIRFEDLVQSPEIIMRNICSRLNINFEEAMLYPYDGERMTHSLHRGVSLSAGDPNFLTHKAIDPKLANAWQKHLDKLDILTPESISLAEELGYSFNGLNQSSAIFKSLDSEKMKNGEPIKTEKDLKKIELSLPQRSIFKRMGTDPLWGIAQHHALNMEDGLDLERLKNSFKKVIQKHPVLRRYFTPERGEWIQYEQESPVERIDFYDLTGLDEEERKKRLSVIEQELIADLKIDSAPLMRVAVAQYEKSKYELIILTHMLITDGLTSLLLNKDLLDFYWHPEKISQNDSRYDSYVKEVADLEKSEVLKDHREFWNKQVLGQPMMCPIDKSDGPDIISSEKVFVSKFTFHNIGIDTEVKRNKFFITLW